MDKNNKIGDSSGECESIVDGDLYLIRTVSRHPILWDRKKYDSGLRNEVWLKLSEKLKIKLDWLKKRWSYLREQYVKHLKQLNSFESDKPSRKPFKYFNEMSFLADHIQIRKGGYQDMMFQNVYEPTTNEVDNIHDKEMENENVDFVITKNEIDAYSDDDDMPENLFVELTDEENVDEILEKDSSDLGVREEVNGESVCSVHQDEIKERLHVELFKPVELAVTQPSMNSCLAITKQQLPTDDVTDCRNDQSNENVRCEDTIFGELVTSMLKKMDLPNRKQAKKEILNILLSY